MQVSVITATQNPIDIISLAAGTSYNKDNTSYKRVENCVKHRHNSVLEHAVITFRIDGVSRNCSHQLVRHRLASYVQQSQRYVKIDTDNDDWYVTPPSIQNAPDSIKRAYRDGMRQMAILYRSFMAGNETKIKAEDARYLLPSACKTNITMTMNAREFFSFLNLRTSTHAQWEIRELAREMKIVASEYSDQWRQLMELYDMTADVIN